MHLSSPLPTNCKRTEERKQLLTFLDLIIKYISTFLDLTFVIICFSWVIYVNVLNNETISLFINFSVSSETN